MPRSPEAFAASKESPQDPVRPAPTMKGGGQQPTGPAPAAIRSVPTMANTGRISLPSPTSSVVQSMDVASSEEEREMQPAVSTSISAQAHLPANCAGADSQLHSEGADPQRVPSVSAVQSLHLLTNRVAAPPAAAATDGATQQKCSVCTQAQAHEPQLKSSVPALTPEQGSEGTGSQQQCLSGAAVPLLGMLQGSANSELADPGRHVNAVLTGTGGAGQRGSEPAPPKVSPPPGAPLCTSYLIPVTFSGD